MWLMTTRGFFSAVQHRDDPSRLLIRARCEEDIRNLKDLLPDSEPWFLERSDYAWRLECSVAEWAKALSLMALEVDYDNFKNAVSRTSKKHANVYMKVWTTLLGLEDGKARRRFAGGTTGSLFPQGDVIDLHDERTGKTPKGKTPGKRGKGRQS